MIIPVSLRDRHPKDMKIIRWYKSLTKSERSQEIRSILIDYIEGKPNPKLTIDHNDILEKVRVSKQNDMNLDDKLDNLNIGGMTF